MSASEFTLLAFTICNAIQIVSYVPQILCIIRDRNGATAIAYSTWAIWLAGSGATTAYSLINVWDVWLALVNGVHTVCCVVVLVLTAAKRQQGILPVEIANPLKSIP